MSPWRWKHHWVISPCAEVGVSWKVSVLLWESVCLCVRAWSGPQGCKSQCCRHAPWPSSAGRTQHAWPPGDAAEHPDAAGPGGPGNGRASSPRGLLRASVEQGVAISLPEYNKYSIKKEAEQKGGRKVRKRYVVLGVVTLPMLAY